MSDPAVKPEEVKPEVTEAPKAEPAADAAVSAVAEETTVKPSDESKADDNANEAPKDAEQSAEPKEITQGTLSKTHSGLLSFFKQKRFFYFQEDAIPEDKLKIYLHKDRSSKANAAYASQTGRGLLLYSKDETHKDAPHGIIKLADVSEVVAGGATKFVLKLSSGDLHFEAQASERDNWVFTLKSKISEAKASVDAIIESEGYKAVLEKLNKPTTAQAPKPVEKPTEPKDKDVAEAKTDTEAKSDLPENAVTSDEEAGPSETKDVKRSASKKAKRNSFAAFFKRDKLEEKSEPKEEPKDEAKEDTKEEPKPAEVEPATAPSTDVEPSKPEEEHKVAEESKPEATPASPKAKRRSIFGILGRKEDEKIEKPEEKEERKDEHAIDAPKETTGDSTEAEAKPVDVPTTEAEVDKTAASSPPKSGFLTSLIKRDKSPSPKVEKAEEKATKPEETEAKAAVPEAATEEGKGVASATEEANDGATATSPKEKRKPSFFGGFKKDKKVDEAKAESSEDAESAAAAPKGFMGLMRKASRSKPQAAKEVETKEVAAPATVAEESEAAAGAAADASPPAEPKSVPAGDSEAAAPIAETKSQPVQAAA